MPVQAILLATMTAHPTERAKRAAEEAPAGRDASAFLQALYRRQARFVWSVLRGLGVPAASVEDAVQEVFLVAYRKHDEYVDEGAERSWLFRIARYVAANQLRTWRRKGGHQPLDEQRHEDGRAADPERAAAVRQATALLERFLDTLDDAQRDVFVSVEVAGMTAPEVAEALGIKLNTVYSRLRLARGKWERFVETQVEGPGESR